MREKINRLSKGIIDDINPNITIYPESFDASIHAGETVRFDITLRSDNNILIKGLAYSSDKRVKITPAAFGGKPVKLNCEIYFDLNDGEVSLTGNIDLVTNGGEFSIPYSINSQSVDIDNLLDTFKSIEDFADFAGKNTEIALNLFDYNKFTDAPFMSDTRNAALYSAFKGRSNKYLAMKEFVAACRSSVLLPERSNYVSDINDVCDNIVDATDRFAVMHEKSEDKSFINERKRFYKRYLAEYVELRLLYEAGNRKDIALIDEMLDALSKISNYNSKHEYITLHRALVYLEMGEHDTCNALLDSVRDDIVENRQELLDEYFLYEYVKSLQNPKSDATYSFIRLLYKFIDEEDVNDLYYYVLHLDNKLKADGQKLISFLNKIYSKGCISPYLYLSYCQFICKHADYLHNLNDFDLHALYYGAGEDLLNSEVALAVTKCGTSKLNQELYFRLLSRLSNNYDTPELTDAICSMLVRNDRREYSCNKHFRKAICRHSEIMGIYEYYLHTLPEDNCNDLPEEVYSHYSASDSLDISSKTKLYGAVLTNKYTDRILFENYVNRIKEFISVQLKNKNISGQMADIYSKAMELGLIDKTNQFIPFILNAYRIRCNNSQIKSLIVVYPQISNDAVIPLVNGVAYLPIFSQEAVVLFQDAYGNRYFDVSFTKSKLIKNSSDFENTNDFSSENIAPILSRISMLIKKPSLDMEECSFIERCILELPLTDSYRKVLFNKLSEFDMSEEFIMTYRQRQQLSSDEEIKLAEKLAAKKYYSESYSIIKRVGYKFLKPSVIKEICSKLILDNMFGEDRFLMQMALCAVQNNEYDSIILDYLCEHYNGSCNNMYLVLKNSINLGNDTFDMEERLIAQMIFCNNSDQIDDVFEWYASRKKASESIVKAYFTVKSVSYFLNGKDTDCRVFEYIESVAKGISDTHNFSDIYKLALTKYYSEIDELTDSRLALCNKFTIDLINKGLVFPYIQNLSKFIELPPEITDSSIICYSAQNNEKPVLESKILPNGSSYKTDEFDFIYHNYYVKQRVLFSDEKWEYRIFDNSMEQMDIKLKGSISPEQPSVPATDRHALINEIIDVNKNNDDKLLKEKMFNYIISDKTIKDLFKLA